MKRSVVVFSGLALAVLVVASLYLLNRKEVPSAPPVSETPLVAKGSSNSESSVLLAPANAGKQSEAKSGTPSRSSTNSGSRAAEFRAATDLKKLFDRYEGAEFSSDGRAKYYQARMLIVCGVFIDSTPESLVEKMFGKHDKADPNVRARIDALMDQGKECAGFYNAARLTDAKGFLSQAAELGDGAGLSKRLLDIHKAGQKLEAASLARQILMKPSAESVEGLLIYFSYRGEPWIVAEGGPAYTRDQMSDAWRSASCAWSDSDCGSNSRTLREVCWTQGMCQFASFDDYLSRSRYSAADYEAVVQLRERILTAIRTRNWGMLGLAPQVPVSPTK